MKAITIFFLLAITMTACSSGQTDNSVSQTEQVSATYTRMSNEAFKAKLKSVKNPQLIDVRTPREYEKGHLENAQLINYKDRMFSAEIEKLDKNRPVFVYCQAGGRSLSACQIMEKAGFKEVYELKNGYSNWQE